ncbi:MAG TPA: patatin family protein [Candidatus Parcubacteria bacterium]|nr:patatin family protein [Candidatus Parcubacteria bacterium]
MSGSKQPKVGLALGSGGAKGLAHIGVIKALEENNIPIDFIAGSSIGALVGGFYSAAKDIKQIEKIAISANWRQLLSLFVDPSLRQGLIGGEKIKKFIGNYIGKIKFQDLKIPFSAIATDLKTGEIVSINQGEVASAIRASISVPLVFKPARREGRLLADGGLSLPVPVEIVRKMGAELVIAVNLDADYFANKDDNKANLSFYKIANNSINLLRYHLASWNVKDADITIEPKLGIKLGIVHWNKFLDGKDIILAGESATKKKLSQLQELICQKSKKGLRKYFDF